MGLDFSILQDYIGLFLQGLGMTLLISLITVLFGTIIGTPLALIRLSKSKVISIIATSYIEIIRGTPLLLQLYIFAYGIPLAFPFIRFSPFVAGIIALALNSSAYVAEIVRSGIQSIDKGQLEAAKSLGLSYALSMRKVIIPQAIKNVLPSLGNEFVTVVKESSIVSIVGIADLMKVTNTISSQKFRLFEALLFAALLYFIVTFTISKLVNYIERKLSVSHG